MCFFKSRGGRSIMSGSASSASRMTEHALIYYRKALDDYYRIDDQLKENNMSRIQHLIPLQENWNQGEASQRYVNSNNVSHSLIKLGETNKLAITLQRLSNMRRPSATALTMELKLSSRRTYTIINSIRSLVLEQRLLWQHLFLFHP